MTSRGPPSDRTATRVASGGSTASARGADGCDQLDDDQLQELSHELKQIRFERDSLEMRETELVEAFHEVSDASTKQAEVIATLERRLREAIRLADARARDSETAADLADELQHMKGELTRTRRELRTTSSELHDVRHALATGCPDDSPEDTGAEAAVDQPPTARDADDDDRCHHGDGNDADGADDAAWVVVLQQEEIARLEDLLDEEGERRRVLERQIRSSPVDATCANATGHTDGRGGGPRSLADEFEHGCLDASSFIAPSDESNELGLGLGDEIAAIAASEIEAPPATASTAPASAPACAATPLASTPPANEIAASEMEAPPATASTAPASAPASAATPLASAPPANVGTRAAPDTAEAAAELDVEEPPPPFSFAEASVPVEAPLELLAPSSSSSAPAAVTDRVTLGPPGVFDTLEPPPAYVPAEPPAALIPAAYLLVEPPTSPTAAAYLLVEPPAFPALANVPQPHGHGAGAPGFFNVTVTHETHEADLDPLAEDERMAMRLMAAFQEEELQHRRLVEEDARVAQSMSSAFQRDAEAERAARRAAAEQLARSDARIAAQHHDAAAVTSALTRQAARRVADDALIATLSAEAEEADARRVAAQTAEDELLAVRLAAEWGFPGDELSGSAQTLPRIPPTADAVVPVPGMWAGTRLAPGAAVSSPPVAASAPSTPAVFSPVFAPQYAARCAPAGGPFPPAQQPGPRPSRSSQPGAPSSTPDYPDYPRVSTAACPANQADDVVVVHLHRHPDMRATGYTMAPLPLHVPPSPDGCDQGPGRRASAGTGSTPPGEVVRALLGDNRVGRQMAAWVC